MIPASAHSEKLTKLQIACICAKVAVATPFVLLAVQIVGGVAFVSLWLALKVVAKAIGIN